jgi:hypothetical protein
MNSLMNSGLIAAGLALSVRPRNRSWGFSLSGSSTWLNAAQLFKLMILLWACALSAAASEKIELESIVVVPGDLLEYPVAWRREPGVRVEIKLVDAPQGANLTFDAQGKLWINWQTTDDLADETLLLIAIRDIDKNARLQHMRFLVRNANVEIDLKEPVIEPDTDVEAAVAVTPSTAPSTTSSTMPSTKPKPPPVPSNESSSPVVSIEQSQPVERMPGEPVESLPESLEKTHRSAVETSDGSSLHGSADEVFALIRIQNQIVSVGRAVTFRAAVSQIDASQVELSIDRLPANASFEINADGSRTFFWQTGPKDQGEHRFRIVAQHVSNATSRIVQDVIIVVGDPAVGSTQPQDIAESGS